MGNANQVFLLSHLRAHIAASKSVDNKQFNAEQLKVLRPTFPAAAHTGDMFNHFKHVTSVCRVCETCKG